MIRSRRKMIPFLGTCGLAVALATDVRADESKRPITAKDLMRFTWAADPRIVPDGSRVAFVKVAVDEEKDDYLTSIWLVPVPARRQKAEPRPLTNGPHDATPSWSPDGTRLIFTRAAEKDGKPQPHQLYLLSFAGGEPRPLTDLPKGPRRPPGRPTARSSPSSAGLHPRTSTRSKVSPTTARRPGRGARRCSGR